MMAYQFDIKKIMELSKQIDRYMNNAYTNIEMKKWKSDYETVPLVSLLLMCQQIAEDKGNEDEIDAFLQAVIKFDPQAFYMDFNFTHPTHILLDENIRFRKLVDEIEAGLSLLGEAWTDEHERKLDDKMTKLGNLYNHYHVKEKLLFPVIEKYGHVVMTRIIWREDDRIRGLYHGAKNMINRANFAKKEDVLLTWNRFADAFRKMIFQEEVFLFPIAAILFKESDWQQIAAESLAYGYRMGEHSERVSKVDQAFANWKTEDIPFGGGLLTLEEANLILNNLPLEITFVDKRSVFKYFNQVVDAAEMMLIRTPLSIGRNVANCHPPKSLQKVMTLVRDLQTGRRKEESMWFKMKGSYIHITYKALFDDESEFLGILEYVQDIQPFFELPKDVKRELSALNE